MDLPQTLKQAFSTEGTSSEKNIETSGKAVGAEILAGKVKLLEVIEALGPYLTSTEVKTRVIAISFLSYIFSSFPTNFLSEKETKFIVEFLHDRLKDQHLVIPKAILALHHIIKCDNLPEGSSAKLLRQLFTEANIQSHTQTPRYAFFQILHYVLSKKLDEVKSLGQDFLVNFLQSIDGEKDPRNLVLIFNLVPTILNNFEIGPFAEDFFEVLSCYFPIDFTPNSTTGTVTRDELAQRLHLCLSHTNQFSEFLIPLVLEKLDSSVLDAKLDSLRLLELCCERSYGAEDLVTHIPSIWHALRREIFMGGSEVVESAANSLIRALFKVLSKNQEIMKINIDLFYSECKHHLSEPELRLSLPASRILISIAESSEIGCSYIMSITLPLLYEQFTVKTSNPERKGILSILSTLISTLSQFPQLKLERLVENWDEFLGMWFSLLTHSNHEFTLISFTTFSSLLQITSKQESEGDLNRKARELLQAHLMSWINSTQITEEIKEAVIKTMRAFAECYSNELLALSVPQLLEAASKVELDSYDELVEILYEVLAQSFSTSPPIWKFIIPLLVQNLSKTGSISLAQCILKIIAKSCMSEEGSGEFFSPIVDSLIKIAKYGQEQQKTELYVIVVSIIRTVMKSFTEDEQKHVTNNLEAITGALGNALFGSLRIPVNESFTAKETLIQKLISQLNFDLLNGESEKINEIELAGNIQLFATFLNKAQGDAEFKKLLDFAEEFLKKTSEETSAASIDQNEKLGNKEKHLVNFLTLVIKGLALRGFQNLEEWIYKLIKMLENPELGVEVATQFSELVADSNDTLSSDSFCNYRFLYKQRIFQISVPKLVEGYTLAMSGRVKSNYIRALTGQLNHLPHVVLEMELSRIIPLLVASLNFGDSSNIDNNQQNSTSPQLLASTLSALKEMMRKKDTGDINAGESPLSEYFLDLSPRLVRLAQFKGSMEVRILALQCLRSCAKFPTHLIFPIKEKLIRDLSKTLDDPKRLVRKEAVLTRKIWILIGAPGGF